jgi:transitional endoplasmic reticulum ATPase
MAPVVDIQQELNRLVQQYKIAAPGEPSKTDQQQITERVMKTLGELGRLTVQDDAVQFEGDRIQLPARFSGNLKAAAAFLVQLDEQENEKFAFGRTFKYRPWDGAAAFDRACRFVFGTSGLGQATHTMFGSTPPQLVSIAVGPSQQLQVPWGKVSMPPLEADFILDTVNDPEYGLLFLLRVGAPRRNRAQLEAFFDVVENELTERSIYRGKSFTAATQPEFLDLSWVAETQVIYTDEVLTQLTANVWSLLRYTDRMRERRMPLKRAVLLEGPYGTGKSLASALTAVEANQHGWTFIQVRPGKDDLLEALNTAKLYAPAVVQYEDIDTVATSGTPEKISELLDALDGIGNKGNGVLLLATTNNVQTIQKAVMRPGRLDAIVHIGALDRDGTEKLIRSLVEPDKLGDVDYDQVAAAMDGFLPAFMTEAVNNAVRYSMVRNDGQLKTIETADLVHAAVGLRRQLDLMNGAQAGEKPRPTLDQALRNLTAEEVHRIVHGSELVDEDGDVVYGHKLSVQANP